MTVKELQKELSKHPDNAIIYVWSFYDGGIVKGTIDEESSDERTVTFGVE